MVFFVTKLRRDPRFENPTWSRSPTALDLDDQLAEHVQPRTPSAPSCRQACGDRRGRQSARAARRTGRRDRVHDDPEVRARQGRGRCRFSRSDGNIVVMADEAHRSQYASFARTSRSRCRTLSRIGFTGTPIEKADRSTRLVFGDYVSVYRMRQAQEDQATVPIYYESRQIPVEIDDPDAARRGREVSRGTRSDEAEAQALHRPGRSSRRSSAPRTARTARRRHRGALHQAR